ncbi:hypothetical protein [Brevundimonas sp.]|uniref:hypothetical protein n=1 Tax=Brevundimonas sp. TaxID=1871086 RepID=UPI003D0CD427
MTLQTLIPILFLGLAAVLFLTPEIRKHRLAKVGAAVALLGVLVVISYNFGTQAGRDAALRDNRADARAAAEAAKL